MAELLFNGHAVSVLQNKQGSVDRLYHVLVLHTTNRALTVKMVDWGLCLFYHPFLESKRETSSHREAGELLRTRNF